MKTNKIILIISVLTLSSLFSVSCNRYEDGPAISFLSPTQRLTNSWTYTDVRRNGLTITQGEQSGQIVYSQSTIGFEEDGRFSYVDVIRDSVTLVGDGFWEFQNNETELILNYDDTTRANRLLSISRLERRFLWMSEELDDNNSIFFQLTNGE